MNKTKLLQLIDSPKDITEHDHENLDEVIASYPYCQVAHILIAKYSHDQKSMLAPQKIRRAAAYALDRGILRNLIHNKNGFGLQETNIQLKTQVDQIDQLGKPTVQDDFSQFELENQITESKEEKTDAANQSFFDSIHSDSPTEQSLPSIENSDDYSPLPELNTTNQNDEGELLTEGMAITFYHEGKEDEAVRVYQQLAVLHPEKKQYYYNQISILKGTEYIPEGLSESKDSMPNPVTSDTSSFFENLEINTEDSTSIHNPNETNTNLDLSVYEEYNEGKAMGLYYDGKIDEAIAMYEKLIELYPDKKSHYEEQLNDLVGSRNKSSEQVMTEVSQNQTKDLNTEKSFFEGIGESEDPLPDPVEELPSQETVQTEENTNNTIEADNSNQSFFDQISNDADTDSNTIETPTVENIEINEDTPVNIPDVSTLEPVGLDNAEETDYINESEAIMLFNQGKNLEAIRIYEMLIDKNPQKASYYRSQINVLKDTLESEGNQNITPTQESTTSQVGNSTEENNFTPIDLDASTEEISERAAIQLFNLGNTQEAVAVYEKLMLKFPDKKNYFLSQIEILKS